MATSNEADKIELSAEELERLSSDSEGGPARRLTGWLGWLTGIGAFALGAYSLYWTQFAINTTVYRSSFLAVALALIFILYPLLRDAGATRRATIEEWCVSVGVMACGKRTSASPTVRDGSARVLARHSVQELQCCACALFNLRFPEMPFDNTRAHVDT